MRHITASFIGQNAHGNSSALWMRSLFICHNGWALLYIRFRALPMRRVLTAYERVRYEFPWVNPYPLAAPYG